MRQLGIFCKTGQLTARYLAYIWTGLVIAGSLLPVNKAPEIQIELFRHLDKFMHLVMYCGIVFLWCKAIPDGSKSSFLKVLYVSGALGITLEVLQSTVLIGRSFEFLDIIANIMGSILGLLLFYKFFKKPNTC